MHARLWLHANVTPHQLLLMYPKTGVMWTLDIFTTFTLTLNLTVEPMWPFLTQHTVNPPPCSVRAVWCPTRRLDGPSVTLCFVLDKGRTVKRACCHVVHYHARSGDLRVFWRRAAGRRERGLAVACAA